MFIVFFNPNWPQRKEEASIQGRDYELRFIGDHLGGNLNVTNCLKYKSCVSNSVRSTTVDKVEDVKRTLIQHMPPITGNNYISSILKGLAALCLL